RYGLCADGRAGGRRRPAGQAGKHTGFDGQLRVMRSLGALVCGMVAVIMFIVAVPAWWTAHNVASADRFVELMGPVSVDDELHESLAEEAASLLLRDHDVPS